MNANHSVRNLDASRLRAFATVAELGSVTRAARHLHQTQGAVSQQIRKLELQLGHVLFERASSGMVLTDQGGKLLPDALKLLSVNDAIWCSMTSPRCGGVVSIAVTPELLEWDRFSSTVRAFSALHPEVGLSLKALAIDHINALPPASGVDLVIAPMLEPMEAERSLFVDDYVWVHVQGGRIHETDPAPVILSALPGAVRQQISPGTGGARRGLRLVSIGSGAASALGAVRADIAICAIPGRLRPADLAVVGPGAGLPPLPRYRLGMRREGAATPATRALENVLRAQLSAL